MFVERSIRGARTDLIVGEVLLIRSYILIVVLMTNLIVCS